MKKLFTPVLLVSALLMSCVDNPQDIPPGIQTNPIFLANLTVGQEPLLLTAGLNGYAMKTEHYVDGEGITHYIATFSAETCPQANCPSLEFEFYDYQVLSHPESGVESTFQAGTKDFYNEEADGALDIRFFLVQDGFGPGVSFWTTAGDTMPLTTNEIQLIAEPYEYFDLCFHRHGNTNCTGVTSYCFHTLASSPFIGLLKAERSFGDHLLVEMTLQGEEPFTYSWMNGAKSPYILIPAQEGTEVAVGVVVTDASNSRIEINQTVLIENGEAVMCGGSPQFVYSIGDAPFTQFSTVIVRYTDANGMEYSSAYGIQTDALFEILSVSEFEDSPEGLNAKQIELAIDCILYSVDGTQSIVLSTTDIVVAVTYEK